MNLLNRREFVATSLLGAAASAATADNSAGRLLAGAAEIVVTPDAEGTMLIGPMKPSTGVHDDLYARALVISDGERTAAVVTLDYLGFDFEFTDAMIAAVAQKTGIPAGHVLLNCSHTHSAPITAPWGPWEKAKDKPFHKFLPERVAEVADRAMREMKPARFRFRREPVQIGFNRRLLSRDEVVMAPNPAGPVLPWVDVLAVERPDGKPVVVLFSHAAHPVVVHSASTLISADYPGFAVKSLQRARKGGGVYMFAQGCCGNINAFPLQGGMDAAAAVGRDLAAAVGRALDAKLETWDSGQVRVSGAELKLPLQAPPPADQLRREMEREKGEDRKKRLIALLDIAQAGEGRTMRFPIRALTLGDRFCLLSLPHDTFAEYALHADAKTPFPGQMTFGYTNGLECYVGTRQAYELGERGGYETSPRGAAWMFEARLPLAPAAEELIKQGIESVLHKQHE